MTDKETLLAMSAMLEPVRKTLQDIRSIVQGLQGDIQKLQPGTENELEAIEKVNIMLERVVLGYLKRIEERYIATYEVYKKYVEEFEEISKDISEIKVIVAEHDKIIQRIS